ncbi:MAG: DHHA1 domain-containing protein [Candidatus Hydrothermarchaeota archaeon]
MPFPDLREAVQWIEDRKNECFRCVSHYDADGISAAGILGKLLIDLKADFHFTILRQLEKDKIKELARENYSYYIFTDFGSGQLPQLQEILINNGKEAMVIDHHQPEEIKPSRSLLHINAHEFGMDGSREISGSGMTYLIARGISKNYSHLAIVGALGDMQDRDGKLIGVNREILNEGEKEGTIKSEIDLRFFGRFTRPIYKAMEYTTDPFIPGITGNEERCLAVLRELGIKIKDGEHWRRVVDLDFEEKKSLATYLLFKILGDAPEERAESLIGEVYTVLGEDDRSELRDAKSFATLLNACGRNNYGGVGLSICLGERDSMYKLAENILLEHRRLLSESINILNELEVSKLENIQYFHGKERIKDSIIGTVTMMGLGTRIIDVSKPSIGMVYAEDNLTKVSARTTRKLCRMGINLGLALKKASEQVGGEGGGHDIAAGAKIPREKEQEFLRAVDSIVGKQLGKG